MKPFQEELRKLDILEEMMMQSDIQAEAITGLAKPNGHAKTTKHRAARQPYTGMSQKKAVQEILRLQGLTGLNARQITSKLEAGGYLFTSKQPLQSLSTQLRYMVKDGLLRVEEPDKRNNGDGVTNVYFLAAKERV